jgi:hypothetical protein
MPHTPPNETLGNPQAEIRADRPAELRGLDMLDRSLKRLTWLMVCCLVIQTVIFVLVFKLF